MAQQPVRHLDHAAGAVADKIEVTKDAAGTYLFIAVGVHWLVTVTGAVDLDVASGAGALLAFASLAWLIVWWAMAATRT